MRDKITKKKIHRFDYYQFMVDRNIWVEYCIWKHDPCFYRELYSENKNRHDFLVSKGLFKEIKGNFLYDRHFNGGLSYDEALSVIHKKCY